ncbi:hypothetical protein KC19_VG302900 [Ceratodon purpureus]|uniref:PHD-type domain-containing protein n=1 Tax=Ceratodon purpureus TaxID=3225 RepID=A0A8T0HV52_CERPU|nr:hypothetical protein KC19_VG302900 [Ceratodon purpureus]
MEILANNGHSMANEVGNAGRRIICQVEDGLFENESLTSTQSDFGADHIADSSRAYLEDEGMKVDTKKRSFDEVSKDLHIPSKKPAVRSSSDTLAAEVDPMSISSPLTEAIDASEDETGEREPGSQSTLGSFEQVSSSIITCTTVFCPPEIGNHVSTETLNSFESVQETLNLQRTDVTLTSVDCSMDTVGSEEDFITVKSAQLEVKDTGAINQLCDSLGFVIEEGAEKGDTMILQNIPKIGPLDFDADEQFTSNAEGEETTDIVTGTEKSLLDTVVDGDLLSSRPSEVDSEKIGDELHVARTSSTSTGEVCASQAQMKPPSLGDQSAQACQVIEEPAAANGSPQYETKDGGSRMNEVDELQVEKADAVKALELKMVEVIMRSPELEVAGSRTDETLNLLSDDPLSVREQEDENRGKDIMNGLSEDDKFIELFQAVAQLPEHLVGANGFLGEAFDVEDLGNGQVSDNLQQGHVNTQPLLSKRLEDPRSAQVTLNKGLDCSHQSGSDKGDGSMDRLDLGIATQSAAISAKSQSFSLKTRMNLKAPEVPLKISPSLSLRRGLPIKEILLKEAPASAKLLLASGLLDGHQVRYLGRGGHVMLTGVIQEGGVRCDCTICKGVQVVNVSAFEKHAGSSARHPSDFIFLENGKCIKDILEIGWSANKEKKNVMDVLKSAIGEVGGELVKIGGQEHPSIQNLPVEKKLKLSLDSKPRLLPDTKPRLALDAKSRMSLDSKPGMSLDSKPRVLSDAKARPTTELKARGNEGRSSLPRDRNMREKEKEIVSPPVLNRETSGPNLHKALFLPGGLEDDTDLGYYVKGQKFLTGVKLGAGIFCSCCEQVISCSLFEQHAGWGSRRNPYTSIYLRDGRSLHDAAQSLVVEQTVKQEGLTPSKIEHLDQCVECGDSGDLQLCTGCPSTYHQDCLGSEDPPTGDFFCPDCQEQLFGGTKDRRRSMAKRRSKGAAKTLLTKDRVTGRCTRLLQVVPEAASIGGCVFCKSGDFAKSGFGPMTTMLCDQCEREYHVGCLKKHGLEDLKELPEGEWFCGQDCKHIHSILSLLVANGPEPLADSIISKVLKIRQQLDKSDGTGESGSGCFEWQLLHGRGGDPANGKTLAEAVQIFSECFDPIADGVSGGDLIPLMVYRRSIRDQDFGGIYCVVLKQFGMVVSTALIRVFGRQLAELPLLATNPTHQGQGHCKALLLSIERLLGVLRVERLALPAAEGAEGIWLKKFGFRRMSEEQANDFHTDLNMMIFTGSFMLEKEIAPLEITGSA